MDTIDDQNSKALMEYAKGMGATHWRGGKGVIYFYQPTVGGYTVSTWHTQKDDSLKLHPNLGRVAELPEGAQSV